MMLGGIPFGHRELFDVDSDGDFGLFEQTVERLFGNRLRHNVEDAKLFWGALANVEWNHPLCDDPITYSFRAAGDLIAAIRRDEGDMTYMKYYCGAPDAIVPDWVRKAMQAEGWTYNVR